MLQVSLKIYTYHDFAHNYYVILLFSSVFFFSLRWVLVQVAVLPYYKYALKGIHYETVEKLTMQSNSQLSINETLICK